MTSGNPQVVPAVITIAVRTFSGEKRLYHMTLENRTLVLQDMWKLIKDEVLVAKTILIGVPNGKQIITQGMSGESGLGQSA